MSTTWKARPTTYRGIQMRSRLEARVAAWFDSRPDEWGEWEYEPRAFGGQRGQYLPDFAWPTMRPPSYIEVKPTTELGMPVLGRMEIILESEPAATLMVMVPGAGVWLSHERRRSWKWWPDPKVGC